MMQLRSKIKLGISACLLGEKVRYDGGNKRAPFLKDTLGACVTWVPVCPEVEFGLPVPREPMRLEGNPASPLLVTVNTQADRTDAMLSWAKKRVRKLDKEGLSGFVFKANSPSCGLCKVKVYGKTGRPKKSGSGIFAHEFVMRFPHVPAEDEESLFDPCLWENFIGRAAVHRRWQGLVASGLSFRKLTAFHESHRLFVLAHRQRHCRELDRLLASSGKANPARLAVSYLGTLMDCLRLTPVRKKDPAWVRGSARK